MLANVNVNRKGQRSDRIVAGPQPLGQGLDAPRVGVLALLEQPGARQGLESIPPALGIEGAKAGA